MTLDLNDEQALADFWTLEKQRFEALEAAFIEQSRQQQPLNGGQMQSDTWNNSLDNHFAGSDYDPVSKLHPASAAQGPQRQPPVPVQQLGSNHVRQVEVSQQSHNLPCALCVVS